MLMRYICGSGSVQFGSRLCPGHRVFFYKPVSSLPDFSARVSFTQPFDPSIPDTNSP